MRISKYSYLLIYLLFATDFWNFVPLIEYRNYFLVITIGWAALAYPIGKSYPRDRELYSRKYMKFFWLIFAGVFISMFSADFFHNQSMMDTAISQRYIYAFTILPALFFLQPSYRDIRRLLKSASVITLAVWVVTAFWPEIFTDPKRLDSTIYDMTEGNDLSGTVGGIRFVIFYVYILIQEYLENFTFKKFLRALFWIAFIILFQNRSMILGLLLILIYSTLFKFHSKYKPALIVLLGLTFMVMLYVTSEIVSDLYEETQVQIADPDYARWAALRYYLFDYSPNWWCYLFGNGSPAGGRTDFGIEMNMQQQLGIFASDLGMIGMWTTYGLLPLLGVYYIVLRVLSKKKFPLMLKFMCFHILAVPTIFHFWENPNIYFFALLIYLYAYFDNRQPHVKINSLPQKA